MLELIVRVSQSALENWSRYGQSDIRLIVTPESKRDIADFFRDTIDRRFSKASILFLSNAMATFYEIMVSSLSLKEMF